jgi:23S rRNA (cytidine1920-2'-O)/16S rRNA (cytidine1409-2'-O)-methyltransferase
VSLRLDVLMVSRGLVESRARARAAIESGGVTVAGRRARAASEKVTEDTVVTVEEPYPWVGRGALKLAHALDRWPISLNHRIVLDVGASTGGFTEVCLARGATQVFAVDVGHGQLHRRIGADPRVVNLERTDARTLTSDHVPNAPDVIVCDASFISLTKILPASLDLASETAELIALIKPQFEAEDRGGVGKGGIVKDPAARSAAVERVCDWLGDRGWAVRGVIESPVTGGDGNVEYLVWATHREDGHVPSEVEGSLP